MMVRLRGGPFDGDEAKVSKYTLENCPAVLYTFACSGCQVGGCPMGGIHWCVNPDKLPLDKAELYWRDEIESEDPPVRIYVHTDLPSVVDPALSIAVTA